MKCRCGKKKAIGISVVAVVLVALAFGLGGCTKFKAMSGPFVDGGVNEHFVSYAVGKVDDILDLTDAQRIDLETALATVAQDAYDKHKAMEGMRLELAEEVLKPNLDPAFIDGMYERKVAFMNDIYSQGRDQLVAFHAQLTPEQRTKLSDHIRKSEGKCGFGKHRW